MGSDGDNAQDQQPSATAASHDDARRDGVVSANIAAAGAATTGSAAAVNGIAAQDGGSATTSAAAEPISESTAKTGGGSAIKITAATLGCAVLIGGAIVSGSLIGGSAEATINGAQVNDDGITDFDFANASFDLGSGTKYQLTDGRYVEPGYEGDNVGLELSQDPVFVDVDNDNDLDAATLVQWLPSAGHTVSVVLLWRWDGEDAKQVKYPVMAGYNGTVGKLDVAEDGFALAAKSVAPPPFEGAKTESITVGMAGNYPVEVSPRLGAVDRCATFKGVPNLGRAKSAAKPLVAPDADAKPVGKSTDFTDIVVVNSDRNLPDWKLAQLSTKDGKTSCGWLPASDVES